MLFIKKYSFVDTDVLLPILLNLISQYHESPDDDYCVALVVVVVVVVVIIVVLRGIDSQYQLADLYPLPYYSNTLQFDHTLY